MSKENFNKVMEKLNQSDYDDIYIYVKQLSDLLKEIDENVLLPFEHSYYKNRIKELI